MKHPYIKQGALLLLAALFCSLLGSCNDYLDVKPDKKLVVPSSLADLQSMIDNFNDMSNYAPASGEVSADDYYLSDADWASRDEQNRRMYLWEKDHLFDVGSNGNDWYYCFNSTYVCNEVLSDLKKIQRNGSNAAEWDNLKGQALFFRSMNYLNAAFIWCMAYDESSSDLGLPLRLDPDFNIPSVRASLRETYQQILQDAKSAVPLLPSSPANALRAGKPAAHGLLARAYWSMRDYHQAGLYADSCLQLYNTLLDYNDLTASTTYPIKKFNAEVFFERLGALPSPLNPSRARIDSNLYAMYATGDLRKTVFFKKNTNGTYAFKGSYEGGTGLFCGLATDEMYLIRAESFARDGHTDQAMADLNTLLRKRWNKSSFRAVTAATSSDALQLILLERRKELLMRGLRWMDVKRLNKEGRGISLARKINGQLYTLPANDLRFALPIPDDVITLSGMQQNPR